MCAVNILTVSLPQETTVQKTLRRNLLFVFKFLPSSHCRGTLREDGVSMSVSLHLETSCLQFAPLAETADRRPFYTQFDDTEESSSDQSDWSCSL